jgi:hypothetical protein
VTELTGMLRAYLFTASTQGKKQMEIFKRFQYIPREQILNELNALWAEERVQRFTIKPNVYVWRATDKFNV